MTLTPAYGRDYKSGREVRLDWNAGKDFLVAEFLDPHDGKPANQGSLKDVKRVQIRYNGLRKVLVIR